MKRLLTTFTGGFPLTQDDLAWFDNALREGLLSLVRSQIDTRDYAILYGCQITDQGTYYDIAPGWLWMNNEIYEVPAHTLDKSTSQDANYYWDEDITYDASGLKAFEDGIQHNVYEVKKAKLAVIDGQLPQGAMPMAADDIVTIWKSRLNITDILGIPVVVDLNSANVTSDTLTLSSITGKLEYKIIGKTVMLGFNLSISIDSIDTTPASFYITFPSNIIVATEAGTIVPVTMYQFVDNYNIFFGKVSASKLKITPSATGNFVTGAQFFMGQIFFTIQ